MLMSLLDLSIASLLHFQQFDAALKLVLIQPSRLPLSLRLLRGLGSFTLDRESYRINLILLVKKVFKARFVKCTEYSEPM